MNDLMDYIRNAIHLDNYEEAKDAWFE
jgi:hypothetical protein